MRDFSIGFKGGVECFGVGCTISRGRVFRGRVPRGIVPRGTMSRGIMSYGKILKKNDFGFWILKIWKLQH